MNIQFYKRLLPLAAAVVIPVAAVAGVEAVDSLIERIAPGESHRFTLSVEPTPSGRFFEIAADSLVPGNVAIKANDNNSLAMGVHHYLKYFTGNHLSWNCMTAILPEELPLPQEVVRRDNPLPWTYYLNYCTHSYSMAFWDWERWQREIDWMALHGVNLPLALTGADVVWRNTLLRLGYTKEQADSFVAGPAFQAWWLMNNLEGWGGPNSDGWYEGREKLQKRIVDRMARLDIHPVLPGYSGMVPHDAREKLALDVADPGLWCAFNRPAFLQPADSRFDEVADIYYDELTRLYGKARFYAMDPFHEGGNAEGVDLRGAAGAITRAMKRCSEDAVWVVQAWQDNPRRELLEGVGRGDMLVLDLWAESDPHWGDPAGGESRRRGFASDHEWLFCMLLNFGGNVGLHGKMMSLGESFGRARSHRSLRGVGMTMEGIENNPVMYEMLSELPWSAPGSEADWQQWLDGYVAARYGGVATVDSAFTRAWRMLARSIYSCPAGSRQQGTSESIFCARPAIGIKGASSWVNDCGYYDRDSVITAAGIFSQGCASLPAEAVNDNLRYDLTDIMRQAIAERGRKTYDSLMVAVDSCDIEAFRRLRRSFMSLLMSQDSLLADCREMRLDTWLDRAAAAGATPAEKKAMQVMALRQITTWGSREASERGGLHDYAHKEWSGLLKLYYAPRWSHWFDLMEKALSEGRRTPDSVDWFEFEDNLNLTIIRQRISACSP